MKPDSVCDNDTALPAADSERLPRGRWSPPSVERLRAGLAETGPNAGYDGVEGTS